MKIGIIGHGKDKFTSDSEAEAKSIIESIICDGQAQAGSELLTVVSGHSPVGGVDIWAEDVANEYSVQLDLKVPKQHTWDAKYGYKQRNLDIARDSEELHVILVDKYPIGYNGTLKFNKCYHCNTDAHIKSGACWTAKEAQKLGKPVIWHIIKQEIT